MAFRRAGHEPVNAFPVGGAYLFKHYFEGDAVFRRLRRYYNNAQYRFEVPPDDFDEVRSFLADHGYGLVVVDELDPFVVVVLKYTSHPDNIFKESVIHRGVPDYNCFLMTDREAVERAVEAGATRLEATGLENPFVAGEDGQP